MRSQIRIPPNRFNILFPALSIVLTLAGCVTNVNIPTEILGATSTLAPTLTITPSPSPSQTTVSPTRTPVTPIPTLFPAEKEVYLLSLIETNGGCELPCFLGIQPGVSTWEEIRRIEEPIHFREQYLPNDSGSVYFSTYLGREYESLGVTFWGSDNIIEKITVKARVHLTNEPVDYFPEFAKAMNKYYFPSIFDEFGVPSRILLYVHGNFEPNSGTVADIYLFYDQEGILFNYYFEGVFIQGPDTGYLNTCLNFENLTFITIIL